MKREENKSRICVSISRKSVGDVLDVVKRVESVADVIEVRLDSLDKIELALLTEAINRPLLMTNRPTWEGGQFSGAEQLRLDSLLDAIQLNCQYVDLELLAPGESLDRVLQAKQKSASKLILSWHNFEKTPSGEQLSATMKKMADKGADIGKIVTMAHHWSDVLRVLSLQEEAAQMDFPLIAFCMGSIGVISRVATLQLGGYMTYCAADENESTAPGQLSITTLRHIYQQMAPDEH